MDPVKTYGALLINRPGFRPIIFILPQILVQNGADIIGLEI
jgi:hypothetical protein